MLIDELTAQGLTQDEATSATREPYRPAALVMRSALYLKTQTPYTRSHRRDNQQVWEMMNMNIV